MAGRLALIVSHDDEKGTTWIQDAKTHEIIAEGFTPPPSHPNFKFLVSFMLTNSGGKS